MRFTFSFLFALMILIGLNCSQQLKHIPPFESVSIIDFSKYADKGFLFTPEPYNGEYESVGLMNCIYRAEANKETIRTKSRYERDGDVIKSIWVIDKLDISSILDAIYAKADSMGGNAIMNFNLSANDKTYNEGTLSPVTVPGIEIYGFVIKRKAL